MTGNGAKELKHYRNKIQISNNSIRCSKDNFLNVLVLNLRAKIVAGSEGEGSNRLRGENPMIPENSSLSYVCYFLHFKSNILIKNYEVYIPLPYLTTITNLTTVTTKLVVIFIRIG